MAEAMARRLKFLAPARSLATRVQTPFAGGLCRKLWPKTKSFSTVKGSLSGSLLWVAFDGLNEGADRRPCPLLSRCCMQAGAWG